LSAEKTTREQLVEALTPMLPKKWRVIPFSRNVDIPTVPFVMVHASRIAKMPEAPGARHTVEFTVSVFDPHDDPSRAQGALDDEVIALIHALDTIRYVKWTSAEASQLGQATRA
jgi:hypothetical protein